MFKDDDLFFIVTVYVEVEKITREGFSFEVKRMLNSTI